MCRGESVSDRTTASVRWQPVHWHVPWRGLSSRLRKAFSTTSSPKHQLWSVWCHLGTGGRAACTNLLCPPAGLRTGVLDAPHRRQPGAGGRDTSGSWPVAAAQKDRERVALGCSLCRSSSPWSSLALGPCWLNQPLLHPVGQYRPGPGRPGPLHPPAWASVHSVQVEGPVPSPTCR